MRTHIFLVLISFFLITGCEKEGVIEEDKFVLVYSDLLIAGDTVAVAEAKKEVFPRYNITENDYKTTVDYYNSHPDEWEPFFNKVIAHIEELRKKPASSTP